MFMPVVKGSNTREVAGGIHELAEDLADSAFHNRDMAPTTRAQRKWGTKDIAALWISMSACIPTYTLASSLIDRGMNWWQAVLTIFLGNSIVLVPMALNAHAGTRYGIPFPVYCRAAFGVRGANVPALMRALVACGWFGIQTWIGGMSLHTLLAVWFPEWTQAAQISALGISLRAGGRLRTHAVPAFGIRRGPAARGALRDLFFPGADCQRQLLGDPG